ncbi:MAG: alpha/beta hydrolase family protein [Gammaproteobacteria bacterium]
MELRPPRQWDWLSAVPIVAGLYWLLGGNGAGWLLWALLPGALLLCAGVALLLMPGDHRVLGLMAGGAVLGTLATPLAWLAGGAGAAFYGALLSVASLLAAGRAGLRREPLYTGAPPPQLSPSMDFKAGLDEALLGYFLCTARVPSGEDAGRMCDDAIRAEAVMRERGWDAEPERMLPRPAPPDETFIERARVWGFDHEVLRFDSGFMPPGELPGAERWLGYEDNRRCHVRLLRHPGPPRPWLLCLHGYRMGTAWLDLSLFSPAWLHQRLGLNLIQPVLPLHGPRRAGLRSGDQFLDGDLLDLLYAEMQALWDLRRTLAWLRTQEERPRIGVLGFSLGGYNAALLAAYESDLDFVVAGIPAVDFAATLWRFLPPLHLRYFASRGLDEAHYRRVLSVVSPLSRPPLVDRSRLHIFAAAGDRVVPPSQALTLSAHWQVVPTWYQGSHLSVRREPTTRAALAQALAGVGWGVE